MSHEIARIGVPTLFYKRKATPTAALARAAGDPAGSKNLCTHGTFMRENREIPPPPVARSRGEGPLREG